MGVPPGSVVTLFSFSRNDPPTHLSAFPKTVMDLNTHTITTFFFILISAVHHEFHDASSSHAQSPGTRLVNAIAFVLVCFFAFGG